MPSSSPADITAVLEEIVPPPYPQNIISLGWVQGLQVREDGNLLFTLDLPPTEMKRAPALQEEIRIHLEKRLGLQKIHMIVTTHRPAPKATPQPKPQPIPGVKCIVGVASGKGGVGKSTTTLNLAVALSQLPLNVGILDADVYGPSLPILLNLKEKPLSEEGKTLIPLRKYGLACMSMGFLMPEEKAAIWRGPMIHAALQQMLHQVKWGTLDILLVDLPPGTGDIPLSLAQLVPLTGVIIVSTPQDLALLDARRSLDMFSKVGAPILGIIENMSYFSCPFCHNRSDIFHTGGARVEAEKRGLPFLGEIPLHLAIRQSCDAGLPLGISAPESPETHLYGALAQKIWTHVQEAARF